MNPFYENKPEEFLINKSNLKHFPAHLHINLEMLYILNGPYEMSLDGVKQVFDSGDFVIIFPNVIHAYNNDNENSTTIAMMCNREYFGESAHIFLNFIPNQNFVKAEFVHKDVKNAIESLYEEKQLNQMNISAVKSLLQLIFARILPQLQLNPDNNNSTKNMTSKIITYICENFKEDISLDVLSQNLGISKSYISKIFSNKIKISLNDYVNSQRVEYAKILLKSEDNLSILQISQQCGYDTQRTFNRVFQKRCGVSPREFRSNC